MGAAIVGFAVLALRAAWAGTSGPTAFVKFYQEVFQLRPLGGSGTGSVRGLLASV